MENKVLAVVAGHEVTEEELVAYVEEMPQEQRAYMENPKAKDHLLNHILQMYLFAEYGKEQGLKDTEDFKSIIAKIEKDVLCQMAVNSVLKEVSASDEEIEAYYEANKDSFKKAPQANAKHILTETEEESNKVLEEINAGEKTFEDAAKEYSTCPSKEQGGDLGTFGRGQMVAEFDQAVFEGEVGKVIGPVKTQFGYHLIRIESRTEEEIRPLEEVKDQIKMKVLEEKQRSVYNAKVLELEAKYPIERR